MNNLILGEANIKDLKIDNGEIICFINGTKYSGTYSTEIEDIHEYYCTIESLGPWDNDLIDNSFENSWDLFVELIENSTDFQDQSYETHLTRGDYFVNLR